MEKKDVVKCRFCEYQLARRYRTKGGKFRLGAAVLVEHVKHAHPEESERIADRSIREYPEQFK